MSECWRWKMRRPETQGWQNKETVMSKPILGWFEITGKDGPEIPHFALTSAFIVYPERHVVGFSKGAVQ